MRAISNDIKGTLLAIISGATFGLIPLFVIPVMADGMGYASTIFYRFLFGGIGMLGMLLYRQTSLRIGWGDFWRISLLSLIYVVCAITLFKSYDYITSGVATALIYTNPIWCALIRAICFRERTSWSLAVSLLLAVVGVAMLSGALTDMGKVSWIGLLLGMTSGIGYGIYLVALPRLKIKKMPSLKLNFYIFIMAAVYILPWCMAMDGGVEKIHCTDCLWGLLLVGFIPTAFSNICVTMALRLIDTTVVAILGAFEPFTAMLIGITLLGEAFDVFTITGGVLVLVAVTIITLKKR